MTEKWAHYATPDPEFQAALEAASFLNAPVPSVPGESEIITRQRLANQVHRSQVEAAGPPVGLTVEDRKIPVTTPPGEVEIRVYTPHSDNSSEVFPLYVNFHGGGYCLGSLDTDALKCRKISSTHRLVVIDINYRHAPQFPWPTAPNDSYDATKWIVANASNLRVDLTKGFIVGGASAGGNLASLITQRARNDPDLRGKITGQALQVPNTLIHDVKYGESIKGQLLSREQCKNDFLINEKVLQLLFDAYKPPSNTNNEASPLLADSLNGLPPALIQIAGADPLRDEGLLYEQGLRESGIATKLEVYPGVHHAFAVFFPNISQTKKWEADLNEGLRWLLSLSNPN